jgi:hypothetical protein
MGTHVVESSIRSFLERFLVPNGKTPAKILVFGGAQLRYSACQRATGWLSTAQGCGSMYNPRGYAVLRIMSYRRNTSNNPLGREFDPFYDQFVLVEV